MFDADTDDGILAQVAEHAERDHGLSTVPPELVEQVRTHIKTVEALGRRGGPDERAPSREDELRHRLAGAPRAGLPGSVADGGHPLELVLGATAGRLRVTTTGLVDAPALVAQRAMARPEEVRLDPLVVCDDGGRALGLVTVERLVGHLAQP